MKVSEIWLLSSVSDYLTPVSGAESSAPAELVRWFIVGNGGSIPGFQVAEAGGIVSIGKRGYRWSPA